MIFETPLLDELERGPWPSFIQSSPWPVIPCIVCGPEEHDQGESGDSDAGD